MSVLSKLQRLMNPQTIADYGLSVSIAELKSDPEFSGMIDDIELEASKSREVFRECLHNAENARGSIALKALMGDLGHDSARPNSG